MACVEITMRLRHHCVTAISTQSEHKADNNLQTYVEILLHNCVKISDCFTDCQTQYLVVALVYNIFSHEQTNIFFLFLS